MVAATDTTQLNIRIDRALKAEGDANLEMRGISPTQAIRSLWQLFAKGGDTADRMLELLEEEDGGVRDGNRAGVAAARRATQLFDEGCATLGISGSLPPEFLRPWDEMRDESIASRLGERGMV